MPLREIAKLLCFEILIENKKLDFVYSTKI